MCDQISDAVLDAYLSQDPDSKVACGEKAHFPKNVYDSKTRLGACWTWSFEVIFHRHFIWSSVRQIQTNVLPCFESSLDRDAVKQRKSVVKSEILNFDPNLNLKEVNIKAASPSILVWTKFQRCIDIQWWHEEDKTGFLSFNQSSLSHYLAVLWILSNKSSPLPQKGTSSMYFCAAMTVLFWVGLSQTGTKREVLLQNVWRRRGWFYWSGKWRLRPPWISRRWSGTPSRPSATTTLRKVRLWWDAVFLFIS